MILFRWKPEYEIHLEKVDQQHKGLVEMINALYAAKLEGETESAIALTLDKLLRYVDDHFCDEEAAMQEWSYPGLKEHRLQHEELERHVLELRKRHMSGRGIATFELLNFLSEWFKVHIVESDKQFGLFVETQQKADFISEQN
jgi:hemerythrin-like metal-binding protein